MEAVQESKEIKNKEVESKKFQLEHQSEPQPPLYTCKCRCYTCGKVISNIWYVYCQDIKKLTGNELTNIPVRTIGAQKLMGDKSKTEEGKIMDRYGIIKTCCRRMILSEPVNTTPIME